jgi:hypothetical protein
MSFSSLEIVYDRQRPKPRKVWREQLVDLMILRIAIADWLRDLGLSDADRIQKATSIGILLPTG